MEKINILVCSTGSVATIKLPVILKEISSKDSSNYKISLRVCLTSRAKHFCPKDSIAQMATVFTDEDEWNSWNDRGDPVLHIDLTKWADVLLIAPLSANTLAKIANGICDNMVTCLIRAWEFRKPLLFCPAMNTKMWEHPITSKQINTLKEWNYQEIPCIAKTLMCGDIGLGAMAEPDEIVKVLFLHIDKIFKERDKKENT